MSDGIRVVKEFLVFLISKGDTFERSHIVPDPDGLDIAPQTHEHIEIGEQTHVEGLPIV